jgi:2-oxoglutarate-dependent dioxygenase
MSVRQEEAVKPTQLTENELRFYNKEGYLYLPGLISREMAAAMHDEVVAIYEAMGVDRDRLSRASSSGDKLRQTTQYLPGSHIDRMVNSPALKDIAGQLMGGPSTLYMPFSAVKNGGGGGKFHFHQDNMYTRFDGPGINIWFALMEMSPENGCLLVAPRTHLRGTMDSDSPDNDGHRGVKIEPEDFLPMRMMPGDAVAFTRLTLHGSGPNHTNAPRIGYAVQFHRDDVKATWDRQEPRLLKTNPRWDTGPVESISAPNPDESLDGH